MKTRERKPSIFRFNMIEVALALVILAIGLSSVLVLFPVGLKASRSSVADNNLADIAEQMGSYIQSKYTTPEMWDKNGVFYGETAGIDSNHEIGTFDSEDTSCPQTEAFLDSTGDPKSGVEKVMDGLFKLTKNSKTYYLYRQYSDASGTGNDRPVDFEAMIRVGWDTDTLGEQYFRKLDSGNWSWAKLNTYSRNNDAEAAGELQGPMKTAGSGFSAQIPLFYRTLIIEISWPADVEWAKREKRIFRLEMFNENFVPYPQTQTTTP